MKMQTAWIDRNQLLEAGADFNNPELVGVMAVSRTGSIVLQSPLVSFWVVVRGSADLEAREGRFTCGRGSGWCWSRIRALRSTPNAAA